MLFILFITNLLFSDWLAQHGSAPLLMRRAILAFCFLLAAVHTLAEHRLTRSGLQSSRVIAWRTTSTLYFCCLSGIATNDTCASTTSPGRIFIGLIS